MSLANFVPEKNRAYVRRFDHDEATRLRAGDPKQWTYQRLAERYGVTTTAIAYAVNPEFRERSKANAAKWTRETKRALCGGGCGRLVWTHVAGRTGLCPTCWGKSQAKSVRPGELQCGRCSEWKRDGEFPKARAKKARRGRHGFCRPCSTAARQDYRERIKVPCTNCGKPCLPPGEKQADSGLCRDCYIASITKDAA